jgi:hypothetical protein
MPTHARLTQQGLQVTSMLRRRTSAVSTVPTVSQGLFGDGGAQKQLLTVPGVVQVHMVQVHLVQGHSRLTQLRLENRGEQGEMQQLRLLLCHLRMIR